MSQKYVEAFIVLPHEIKRKIIYSRSSLNQVKYMIGLYDFSFGKLWRKSKEEEWVRSIIADISEKDLCKHIGIRQNHIDRTRKALEEAGELIYCVIKGNVRYGLKCGYEYWEERPGEDLRLHKEGPFYRLSGKVQKFGVNKLYFKRSEVPKKMNAEDREIERIRIKRIMDRQFSKSVDSIDEKDKGVTEKRHQTGLCVGAV